MVMLIQELMAYSLKMSMMISDPDHPFRYVISVTIIPGIVGGGYLTNSFFIRPYAFTGVRPPGSKTWGKEHKDFQRINYRRVPQGTGTIPGYTQVRSEGYGRSHQSGISGEFRLPGYRQRRMKPMLKDATLWH